MKRFFAVALGLMLAACSDDPVAPKVDDPEVITLNVESKRTNVYKDYTCEYRLIANGNGLRDSARWLFAEVEASFGERHVVPADDYWPRITIHPDEVQVGKWRSRAMKQPWSAVVTWWYSVQSSNTPQSVSVTLKCD